MSVVVTNTLDPQLSSQTSSSKGLLSHSPPSETLSPLNLHHNQHTFLNDLSYVMTTPSFQQFFRTYMKDWSDTETLCLYIYLSQYILGQYRERYGEDMSPCQLETALRYVFETPSVRREAVTLFRHYQENDVRHTKRRRRVRHKTHTTQETLVKIPSSVFLHPKDVRD